MTTTTIVVPDNVARSSRAQKALIEELATVGTPEYRRIMKAWSVDDLTSAGSGLITFYTRLEETKTDVLKALAKVVVALRYHYRTPEGDVDWGGRSWDYRQAVGAMYQAAGIPPDSESTVQASLRYHVGNLLREIAPPAQLAQVGLLTNSPKDRMNNVRAVTSGIIAQSSLAGKKASTPADFANRTYMGLFALVDTLEHAPATWAKLSAPALETYEEGLTELVGKLQVIIGEVSEALAKADDA